MLTLVGVRVHAPGVARPLLEVPHQLSAVTGADAARVAQVLGRVGLTDPRLARRRPAELSGGQAQRAAIALAVLTGAPLVIADEPTSALDPQTRDEVLGLLTDVLEASGAETRTAPTLVVSTHDPEVADALSARRLEVADGRIVRDIPAPRPESGVACSARAGSTLAGPVAALAPGGGG